MRVLPNTCACALYKCYTNKKKDCNAVLQRYSGGLNDNQRLYESSPATSKSLETDVT